MNLPLAQSATITVIDFETTGSVAGYPVEPWQIGLVTLRNGRVEADTAWESLLRIDGTRPFNPRAPGRHAQIRDQLAASPTLTDCLPALTPRLCGVPLAAHNIGTERTILTRAAPLHAFGPWIDMLALVRHAYPTLPSNSLDSVITALRLDARLQTLAPPERAPHDALYDAIACAVLLEHLLALPGWEALPLQSICT
ncbi:MAG: 3'-5' exonuclease [Kiritimatiellae bacterium]|nr:3'-5' exonuclease [Kiritimatiellia bacterium]